MSTLRIGRQITGSLDQASQREWLVTDGLGGFAMGTVSGLQTRRYHGLLITAAQPPGGRRMGLSSLDPVLVIGDRRVRLATHEWADETMAPAGHVLLDGFSLDDGVPRWRWSVGPIVIEAELAMMHGRGAVGVRYQLVATGVRNSVRLEVEALCTERDVHGERTAWDAPRVEATADGFVFEGAYRVRGPAFEPAGEWYQGLRHREEAARGLAATEDVWFVGRFGAELSVGDTLEIEGWAGGHDDPPPAASSIIDAARARAAAVVRTAGASDATDCLLARAADQFVVRGIAGPTVVAGYPWFGDWSRDTMTSYEGLFLETARHDEGRALLLAAGASVSDGMLANTADVGGTEYNTVDGALWFLHAVGRHIERTGDTDLGVALLPTIRSIVEHHIAGTRFGIRVDADGLVTQGADGWALTWMDARVDGRPITPRVGKPVEVNALWLRGLRVAAVIAASAGDDASSFEALTATAGLSFERRFARTDGGGLLDLVDGPGGDDASVRPNQLLAVSLPGSDRGPLLDAVLRATEPLVTALGLRSLDPTDSRYRRQHRGSVLERDEAYHQGTVWPWLVGPLTDARLAAGWGDSPVVGGLDALVGHLGDWGLGSISETTDGDAPHNATGCPFQAWSVAEVLRARRAVGRPGLAGRK